MSNLQVIASWVVAVLGTFALLGSDNLLRGLKRLGLAARRAAWYARCSVTWTEALFFGKEAKFGKQPPGSTRPDPSVAKSFAQLVTAIRGESEDSAPDNAGSFAGEMGGDIVSLRSIAANRSGLLDVLNSFLEAHQSARADIATLHAHFDKFFQLLLSESVQC
ncbi:hypothetical protein CDD83_4224 [Cordyceps sp. RAO-2017]|nr:hypothetical protein CDD83_4224 [Cordyceps sp. RAO-2017]